MVDCFPNANTPSLAELAVDPILVHGTVEGTSIPVSLWVKHKQTGLPDLGNSRLDLVPNHLEDIPNIEGGGDLLADSQKILKPFPVLRLRSHIAILPLNHLQTKTISHTK